MGLLAGSIAMVTGAGKGIGRAVAKAYAREGASLALISRTGSDLERLKEELGSKVKLLNFPGDAAEEKTVEQFVEKTLQTFLRVDILVNNAGILTPRAPIHEVKPSDWDESIRVNLRAPFLMTKYVLPTMIRQRSGVILNVSSSAGKRDAPEWGPYAVAKFGIEGLTRLTVTEVRAYGIRVNAVNPGGTRTGMRAKAYPEEDPTTLPMPEEVAELFVWLASEEAKGITGQSIDFREWKLERKWTR